MVYQAESKCEGAQRGRKHSFCAAGLDWKRLACGVLGVALGFGVAFLVPDVGLSRDAMLVLGILVWAIVWWVLDVTHEYVTALIMAVLFVAVAGIPSGKVLSAFSGGTWWLLLSAFALGLGMKKSGLTTRIAHAILGVFPKSYPFQMLSLVMVGTAIGPFVPSMSAKTAILAPLSMSIGESFGFKKASKELTGLFLAMLVGVRNVGPAVISASVIGYALIETYPESVRQAYDMLHWLLAALPWFAVVTVLNIAALLLLYRRKGPIEGDGVELSGGVRVEGPGPVSAKEARMALIMAITMLLWIAEPYHGLPAFAVAMAAMAAMLLAGVVERPDFRSGIGWDSVVFIGIVLGLTPVFAEVGVDTWIVDLCAPVLSRLAGNPYALVVGVGLLTLALRFVIVSEMAFLSLFMAFAVPMAVGLGVNPWIVGFASYCLVNPWFLPYQNSVYLAAYYAVDEGSVRHADTAKYCFVYVAICLTGLIASVPCWLATGQFYV